MDVFVNPVTNHVIEKRYYNIVSILIKLLTGMVICMPMYQVDVLYTSKTWCYVLKLKYCKFTAVAMDTQ